MRIAVDLLDVAFEALDAQTSDEAVAGPSLAATVKLYGLQRLSFGTVPEPAGNGRVEFLHRLAKVGVRSFERTPEALAPCTPAIFS